MRRLDGKVILVAGAGGIGGGLARRFAAEGARVVLGDIDPTIAEEAVSDIAKSGGEARAITLDGADEASVAAAVATCREAYGGLDGLHANFATLADEPGDRGILELPLEVFDFTQRVNMRGYYLCTRAALPALLERGGGAIVYTSSIAAYTGPPSQVAYAMAKAAGHALMRHVASRYGAAGIRANIIAPGMTLHERVEAGLTPEFLEVMKSAALIKSRFGRPEDIAAMSALLMSDEGSYITGQAICIDGGMTMRA
ncbi:MAG: SDR family oxidoreductase [Novosphingobium sp.]|nr:SDR family oxidoreductase [Novosphingobium sp.]